MIEEKPCKNVMGAVKRTWLTGDVECNAVSREYECGGIYHNNYVNNPQLKSRACTSTTTQW